jgi:hypothetical protein
MNTKNPGKETPFETKDPLRQPQGTTGQIGIKSHEPGQDLGASAKQSAAEAAEQIKMKGAEALDTARQQAENVAGNQKEYLVERLSHCREASRKAAEQLRHDNDPTMAHYADVMAQQFDKGANYVRSRDVRGIARDAENLARKQPEIFFGGMFIAGLAMARFLKSSSHHSEGQIEEAPRGDAMATSADDDIHLTPVEVPVSTYAQAASQEENLPYSTPGKM